VSKTGVAEGKPTDNGQEIGVFVYQLGSLAFEPPDGRSNSDVFYDILSTLVSRSG
jgi:hypothetical protein